MKIKELEYLDKLPFSRKFVLMGVALVTLGTISLGMGNTSGYFLAGLCYFVSILVFNMARWSYKDEKSGLL